MTHSTPRLAPRRRLTALTAALAATVAVIPAVTGTAMAARDRGATVATTVQQAMRDQGLRAVIVRVEQDGRPTVTRAFGQSMTGVPARPDMQVRIGAVAEMYVGNLILQLQQEGRLDLDDPVGRWLPDLPNADRVTLRMLANFTSGYPDYVPSPEFLAAFTANPFRAWRQQELLDIAFATPPLYEPGTSWNYAHTNYVILGQVIRKVTGHTVGQEIRRRVLVPLGLTHTRSNNGPAMTGPVLHAFDGERGLYEDSTFWNPSWTLGSGMIMTSDIRDMARTAWATGTGALLSRSSFRQMMAPTTVGKGPLTARIHYGLGVVIRGGWVLQNPVFTGYGGTVAYSARDRMTIAVAATPGPSTSDVGNFSFAVFEGLAARLAPRTPVPAHP